MSGVVMEFQPGNVLWDGRHVVHRRLRSACDKSISLGHDRKFDCQVTIDGFACITRSCPMGWRWVRGRLRQLGDHPNVARVVDQWEDDQAAIMVSRYFREWSAGTFAAGSCWIWSRGLV